MRYFSLFSGIGGFELGIQKAYDESNHVNAPLGTESEQEERSQGRERPAHLDGVLLHTGDGSAPLCVGFSEIDRYAVQIYQKHFPEHKNYGDITKIDEAELPDFDLLVGGFPCQSFSIAGRRQGFEDTRGTLFFDIARIVRKKRPSILLLENVKGLLSHDEGRTFGVIISTLDELGYDIQWQVLNSKNHGVPQNRERVFIVGHLRGEPRPQVFPLPRIDGEDFEPDGRGSSEVFPTIRATHFKNGDNQPLVGTLRTHKDGNGFREVKSGLSPTIPARAREDGSGQPVIAVAERGRYKEDGTTEQRLEPRFDGKTNTLAGVEKDNRVFDGMRIRRLTPVECERLQGFPDNWTEGVSDTQRYKCAGNAVTVNVIRDVVKSLLYQDS